MAMDILLLRGIERLAIVLIGGIAIYLGYRLFLAVKAEAAGEAKITLPDDVTVMVSRVGPGRVLRAVRQHRGRRLALLLDQLQRWRARRLQRHGAAGRVGGRRDAIAADAASAEKLELDRLRLRQEIEFLNRLPALLGPASSEGQRATVARHVREVKLRLMSTVWADDWSDPATFRLWAEGGAEADDSEAFRRARAFYDAGAEPAS